MILVLSKMRATNPDRKKKKIELSGTYKFSSLPYFYNIGRENIGGIWNKSACILPLEIREVTFIRE